MSETHKEEPEHGNVFLDRDDLPANQARLIHMLVTDDENEHIPKVLRLNTLSKLSPSLLALLLTRIQESGWWRNPTDGYGPYSSFDECATEITGFASSTCNDLVNNWKWWRRKHKTAEEWVRHCQRIGWTACRAIRLANIDSADIETVVEDIATSKPQQSRLREFLAARYSPNQEQRTSASDGSYSIDDILSDGCFLDEAELEKILERLHIKKNLILQGPPGTGKTWLAKRLAFALIRRQDDSRVRAVQFHPNLSYEDFVRGWRPTGDGKLTLVDGPFLEMVNVAKEDLAGQYVLVIEEINRGNPAQIFGEMLTLLEADKRTSDYALELSYRREEDERVFIPANLYVIGTMNIADRSLALVDLALRRRFAFIDLEPVFGGPWRDWVHKQCGIGPDILTDIEKRILELNDQISADSSLGPQFRIGHSYVTPSPEIPISDACKWFRQVVETEIGPHLNEIWSDDLAKARQARQDLLEGF